MRKYDYIITGCGLSGLMLAYRMANDSFFDSKTILLIDTEKKNADDRTWSFWEEGTGEWDHLLHHQWSNIRVTDSNNDLQLSITPYVYKTIRSGNFYEYLWNVIEKRENITIKFDKVLNISHRSKFASVLTESKEYNAKKAFNSILLDRRFNQQGKYPVLKQHFVGWFIETKEEVFNPQTATFMDFSVEQRDNTRFMYVLPFSKTKALVEYTLFSAKLLPYYEYEDELKLYLETKGISDYEIQETEKGSIPMTCYRFWKLNSTNAMYIGTAGGWTKPSTGYTFKNTSKKTTELIEFLKHETVLKKFINKTRFWFYDLLFLDVLSEKNEIGSVLFMKLFKRNNHKLILKFLDEETTFKEEIKIMLSLTSFSFVKALFKRLRR